MYSAGYMGDKTQHKRPHSLPASCMKYATALFPSEEAISRSAAVSSISNQPLPQRAKPGSKTLYGCP